MPRYFFDTWDDRFALVDDKGNELDGDDAAIVMALRGLGDMTKEAVIDALDRPASHARVEVRNAIGSVIFAATSSWRIERSPETQRPASGRHDL